MTRDEQIIAEAKKHYYDDINCHNAFLHGVEWADEHPANVWHDASEEPKIGSNIIAIDKNGQWWVIQPYDDDYKGCRLKGWESCVHNYNGIQMWAYISDLLPKGGEEL